MQNVVLTGNAILEPRTICFRCHIWIELKLFQLVGAYQDIILFLFDLASQKTCQICKYLQVLSGQDNIYLYCFCSCADMDIDTLPGHLLHWIPAFILPCTMSSKSFILDLDTFIPSKDILHSFICRRFYVKVFAVNAKGRSAAVTMKTSTVKETSRLPLLPPEQSEDRHHGFLCEDWSFTIAEKAPTNRAFSWLKASTSIFMLNGHSFYFNF